MKKMDSWKNFVENEKKIDMTAEISKRKRLLHEHAYKEMLKSKVNKVEEPDLSILETEKLPQSSKPSASQTNQVHTDNASSGGSFSYPDPQKVDYLMRQVGYSDQEERSNIPDHGAQTKKQKKVLEGECSLDTFMQKENLAHSTTSGFVEYWVPVQLSNIQVEQYCSSLFSNAVNLCSSARHGYSEIYRNILLSVRKCCDHPYLVDLSLRESLIQELPETDRLEGEIKLSNKLLLLYKVLEEIRNRGLRVLILYKLHEGCGPISNGDILYDLIDKKFGKESLEWIIERMSSSKRQEKLKIFNDRRNGKLVCLMETRACIPSMEPVSTDCVIIFNSDLDPMNDLRFLQKVKLDSQFEQVKVFRLYSAHTVEEKVLILAKQGMLRKGNIINMTQTAYHGFLSWGVLYLFKRLDDFHNSSTDAHSVVSSDDSFVEDVLLELSALLPNNDQTKFGSGGHSFLTEVQQIEGHYTGHVSLFGEVENPVMENFSLFEELIAKQPHGFWRMLLETRHPRWKYVSSQQSPRTRSAKLQQNKAPETSSMGPQSLVAVDLDVEDSIGPSEFSVQHSMREVPVQTSSIAAKGIQQSEAAEPTSTGSQFPDATDQCITGSLRPGESSVQPMGEEPLQSACVTSPAVEDRGEPISLAFGSGTSLNGQPSEDSQITDMKVLQSVFESLKGGMEGVQKQEAEVLRVHKDKKVQLEMECENEIKVIRKKYDVLLQNAEMALLEEKRELEAKYNRLNNNKSLIEVMMKRAAFEESSSPVTTNRILDEAGPSMVRRPDQIPGNCPDIASNQMSATPCVTAPQTITSTEVATTSVGVRPDQLFASLSESIYSPVQQVSVTTDRQFYPETPFRFGRTSTPPGQQGMIQSLTANSTNEEPILAPRHGWGNQGTFVSRMNPASMQFSQASIGFRATILHSTHNSPVTFSRNLQPRYDAMRAPAPHFRHVARGVPVTTPLPSIPDERRIFSPVNLQELPYFVQNQQSPGFSELMRIYRYNYCRFDR